MKTKSTKTKLTIPATEQELAAMFFALSNTAMLNSYDKDLIAAYSQAEGALYYECGVSLDDEKKMWMKDIKKNNQFVVERWFEVRNQYITK